MKAFVFISVFAFVLIGILFVASYHARVPTLKVDSVKEVHSIVVTHPKDTAVFEFRSNLGEDLMWRKDNILSVTLKSYESSYMLPLNVIDLKVGKIEETYSVQLTLEPGVFTENFKLNFNEAYMAINTHTFGALTLDLGEVNYYFHTGQNQTVDILSVHNLAGHYAHGVTSQGVLVQAKVTGEESCVLIDAHVNSKSIRVNMHYAKKVVPIEQAIHKVTDYLSFDPFEAVKANHEGVYFEKGEAFFVVLPFHYQTEDIVMYRYPLFLVFECETGEKEIVFNDFPYIRTDRFDRLKEGLIVRAVADYQN